jgi:hypothetical protein
MNSKTSFGRLVRSTIQPAKRALAGEIVRRAVNRGEIDAGVDLELALDMLAGPLYWRLMVTRGDTGAGYVEGLVRFILAGLCQTRDRIRDPGPLSPVSRPASPTSIQVK